MRQPFARRKRRKARKARQNAGVPVEIMFRRDVERLAERWRLDDLARAAGRAA